MNTTRFLRPLTLVAAACAVPALALAPAAVGQATHAAESAGIQVLTAEVWTCPDHEQFRMTVKGTCPLCGADLVRRQVILQGSGRQGDPYPLRTCPVTGKELGAMGPPVVMMYQGREVRFCCKGCIKKFEADAAKYLEQIDKKIVEQQLPRYPLTTCVVSGETLGAMGEPVNYVLDNRLVRLCCKGCLRSLKKDPAQYLAALDEAVIAQQRADYPLTACVISKQALGAMGEPVDYVVANRLVRFCCGGCAGTFNRAPGAHLQTIDEAWKKTSGAESRQAPKGKSHDHETHDHDH
jgi:YHS domain-containing protein